MKKKKWTKPVLKVLFRSKPEESVLDFCKQQYGPVIGGPGWATGCRFDPPCLELSAS